MNRTLRLHRTSLLLVLLVTLATALAISRGMGPHEAVLSSATTTASQHSYDHSPQPAVAGFEPVATHAAGTGRDLDSIIRERDLVHALVVAAEEGGPALTRVGRWMRPAEHDAMVSTGTVQEGTGGVTNVAHPADVMSYMRQAKPGTRYVEFDVPQSSLVPGGKEGWATIPGPDSIFSRLNIGKGLPPYEFPGASNIEWLASKLPPW